MDKTTTEAYRADDVITIPEMAKRLKMNRQQAYDMAARKGFPLINITGGERGNRVIWGDVLVWIRENCAVAS